MDAELQALIERANKWCEQAAKRTPEKNALVARALIEDLAAYAAPKLPEVGSRWKRVTRKPGTMGMNPVAIVTRRSADGRVMYSFNHHVDTVADFLRDFEPAGE
jgi:hypothetical protein